MDNEFYLSHADRAYLRALRSELEGNTRRWAERIAAIDLRLAQAEVDGELAERRTFKFTILQDTGRVMSRMTRRG